jgi:O-antigen/teichoic acid export membrane protein
LTIVLGFGVSSAVFREYYREDDEEYKKKIIGTAFSFVFISGFLIVIILISLRSYIAPLLLGVEKQSYLFTLLLVNTFFAVLLGINYAVIRAKEKPILFTIFNILRTCIYAVVNVYLLTVLKRGYVGVCEGLTISTIITFIASSPILVSNMKVTFDRTILKNILSFGLPLIVSGLSLWVLNLTDRYMLKFLLPSAIAFSSVGIYSLAAKLAILSKMIIVQPFSLSWGVAMYKHEKAGDAKEFYAKTFKLFVIIEALFFIGTVVLAQPVIELLAKNAAFHCAYRVVPLLTASAMFNGLFMLLSVGLTLTYKNKLASVATMIAAGLNVGLNFILIPEFQIMGAASASVISAVVMVILQYYFAQKNYKIPYKLSLLAVCVLICLVVTVTVMQFNPSIFVRIMLIIASGVAVMKIGRIQISDLVGAFRK